MQWLEGRERYTWAAWWRVLSERPKEAAFPSSCRSLGQVSPPSQLGLGYRT